MSLMEQQDPVYVHIGRRIRERRKLLKLNQMKLAELMGFSYQQMQKYETGVSHVSAGKLLLFAKILNVPMGYFYEGLALEETIGKRIESNIIQKIRNRALHILLVEDRASEVIAFTNALAAQGGHAELHAAHDPEAVMDLLQNYEAKCGQRLPDIVVFDLFLPRLNGIDLLKSIKKHPKTMGLPVVILTNSISVKDMMESYRHGAAGFIQKSVDPREYEQAIDTLVTYWAKTVALPCA
ncbi:MAG: response regulator [Alphaproteobacteria bacterium]|nr:response regulator [Alphaproteobacteria bacterium]